jgi:lysophospholipase L1-like esterase
MNKIKLLTGQFLVLIISILLIEVILRVINSDMNNYDIEMWRYAKELKVKDSLLGHRHLNNKSSVLQGVEVKLNSKGMRSDEFKMDSKKILFLGSSISLGWGVDNKDSYPQKIQRQLTLDSFDYKVLNASIGNYNAYRYVNNFLLNLDELNPELIVVNYFINDAEALPVGSSNWFVQNSQLVATLSITIKKILSKSGIDLKSYYLDLYKDDNTSFLEMKNSLIKLSEYSKSTNIPVLMTVIPDIHFLEDYPFNSIHDKMKSISKELGFKYHDLLPSLEGISFNNLEIIKGDSHPNELGHSKISSSLYPEIIKILKN